jgi:hypothetical protein
MAQQKTHILSVDCKTDGIGGPCFWIAAVVAKKQDDHWKKEFNGIVDLSNPNPLLDNITKETTGRYAIECINLSKDDRRNPAVYTTYTDLWNGFWDFYFEHRDFCDVIHDCPYYAVENLFTTCATLHPHVRKFQCPPQLLNIASMLVIRNQYSNLNREAFLARNNCSFVPAFWNEKSQDPLAGALTTLSIYYFMTQPSRQRE